MNDRTVRNADGKVLTTAFSDQTLDLPGVFWGQIDTPASADCYKSSLTETDTCKSAKQARIAALGGASTTIPDSLLQFARPGELPKISPAAATFQVTRVARERRMNASQVTSLVDASTHNPTYTLGGALYVNVAELNLRLDGKL